MKAVEFKSRLKNRFIKIPEDISSQLSDESDVRVIVLYNDNENSEEGDFKNLAAEQFFKGYSDSDSIYDD